MEQSTASTDSGTRTDPTPAEAWELLKDGNARFVGGSATSPRQDAAHRAAVAPSQHPHTAILACSDSRLAVEILFDQGLGDMFVMRNAGHTVSTSELGSLEFAVAALGVSLIVVLSHDGCGAVAAAADLLSENPTPLPPHTAEQILPIVPAVQTVWLTDGRQTPKVEPAEIDLGQVRRTHVALCIDKILRDSALVTDAVASGHVAIVGADYELINGKVVTVKTIGVLEQSSPS